MKTSPVITPQAFTIEYPGRARSLITACHVCTAFNPEKDKGPHPETKQYMGLWDTGATGSVIAKKVVDELGLKPISYREVYTASGCDHVPAYLVNILLPNNVGFGPLLVTEGVLNSCDVLIGMDIISLGDFTVCLINGKTKFTFQVPSTHNTDYVKESSKGPQKLLLPKKEPIVNTSKVGRNELCPCGSGKKYKKCHGKP